MSWEQHGFKPTGMQAGADLSLLTNKFVKITGVKAVGAITADTDIPYAVLLNAPSASGQVAELVTDGIAKLVSAGSVTAGDPIGPSSDGSATKRTLGTDTTKHAVGYALETGAVAGDVIACHINIVPNRSA